MVASTHKLTGLKDLAKREGWAQWIRSEADERALLNGCTFSIERAERVAEFFRKFLCHSKGEWEGKPFELLQWQWNDVVAPLFGWIRPNGSRRYRKTYIEIPKKNGKSTLAAGIGLYMLVGDREAGSYVYSAAADKNQAAIVHGEAINMVEKSPTLAKAIDINRTTKNITFKKTRSYYQCLSASPRTKEGFDGHCCIIDELHIWQGRELWDALRYMGRARRQPLIFVITTAGADMLSVCREQHDYAQGVIDGRIEDDRLFPYIREATEEEIQERGIHDRELWRKANPSMGFTIDEEEFARDVEEAVQTPTAFASFKRYSFNVWATAETPWLSVHDWQNCRREIKLSDVDGHACFGGLDLAKVLDMTSLALIFRDPADETLLRLFNWYWLPEETAEERRDLVPYHLWAEQGWLTLTDGNVCDYRQVKRDIVQLHERFRISDLAFDPWNAEDTTQQLELEHGIQRHEFRQTIGNYAHPTAEFERLLRCGLLVNDGNPITKWQAGHVNVKTDDSGNIRPVKPKKEDIRKIDGIVAGIMALDRALSAPPPASGSLCIT